MLIGQRLRELREERHLSQGDVEERSGLLRCYLSRVENGYTVPAVETLEKIARALDMPMYRLFYTGEDLPPAPAHPNNERMWGDTGKSRHYLAKLVLALQKMTPENRELILTMAHRVSRRRGHRKIS